MEYASTTGTATAVELVECLSEYWCSYTASTQVREMRGGTEDAANTPLAETGMLSWRVGKKIVMA